MVRRKNTPKKRVSARRRTPARKRAAPVRAKATAKRTKKDVVSGSSAAAHHAVRMRPFSDATSQPKIPDGVFTSSLSRKLQNVFDVRNSQQNPSGTDILHVVLAPTLGVPLTIFGTENAHSLRGTGTRDPDFYGFNNQTVGFRADNITSGGQTWPPTGTQDFEFFNSGGFRQWRVVSQGLRMELTNTDEENDGWFEACRFNWSDRDGDLCITPLDGSITGTQVGFAPSSNWLEYRGIPMSMVEQPGYQTGTLRDLKKFEFMNHPGSGTHDPVETPERLHLVTGTDMTAVAADKVVTLGATALATIAKKAVIDPNMDWVYIRLHTRTNNGSTLGGSSILCNLTQNLEVTFSPESDFAAFQTVNKLDKRTAQVADAINNNRAAGQNRR